MRLSQVYRQLYSYLRIPEECQPVVELFTLLPRDSFSPEFLKTWFPTIFENAEVKMETLAEGGWLDKDDTGYSMHPLIAQCLLRKVITEERVGPWLRRIQEELLRPAYIDRNSPEYNNLCTLGNILLSICRFLSGSVSPSLASATAVATYLSMETNREMREHVKLLKRLKKHCPDADDLTRLLIYTALGQNKCDDMTEIQQFFRSQQEALTVPNPRYLDFCIYCGHHLAALGAFDDAAEMVHQAICDEAAPYQKACAYYYMTCICNMGGDAEAALAWAEEGAVYLAKVPECGNDVALRLLAMLCQLDIKFGKKEAAAAVLKQIENQTLVHTRLDKSQYAYAAGLYEMQFGDPEKALAHTRVSMEIIEEFEGHSPGYLMHKGQIAGILRKMERYEEAVAVYLELLSQVREIGSTMLLNLYSTNIAATYLALNQPQDALGHLETALRLAREMGGLALGEAQRNRARAFGQLGDTEQEYTCLKEASPLLEEAYGPDHPRSVDAQQRLKELAKLYDPAFKK